MVWDYMLHGMACAAWVVGLVLVLGVFAGLMWLFCTLMAWAFGEDEEEEEENERERKDQQA